MGVQVLNDRGPRGVQRWRTRWSAAAGDAVGLLDEQDGEAGGVPGVGDCDKVVGIGAAAGAVTEYQRPARLRDWVQVHGGGPLGGVDADRAGGVDGGNLG